MKPSEVVKLYMKGLSRKEIAFETGKSYKNVCEQLRRRGLVKPAKLRTVLGRTYRYYPYDAKHPQLVWPPIARPYKVQKPRVEMVEQQKPRWFIEDVFGPATYAPTPCIMESL